MVENIYFELFVIYMMLFFFFVEVDIIWFFWRIWNGFKYFYLKIEKKIGIFRVGGLWKK